MKRVACLLFLCLASAGCFDVLPSDRQCDAQRRCAPEDPPVCGADGVWYECGLVADCEEVAVVQDTATCGSNPPPSTCPDIACDDCENVIETYDADGCLVSCECPSSVCDPLPVNCQNVGTDADECTICLDNCDVPDCGGDGCSLTLLPGDDCPTCQCEPTCEPIDRATCNDDPACSITVDANGCETCECVSDRCDRQFCNNLCQYGYLIIDGCPTCQCNEPCQNLPECDLACPSGNSVDPATGCVDSCSCVSDVCNGVNCAMDCEFGFRQNAAGCQVCECRGAPCQQTEDCRLDEVCVPAAGPFFDGLPPAECVSLDKCDATGSCPDDGACGFYFRQDCCPPLTTCDANLPSCEPLCLLGFGDLPRSP